MTAIIDYGVGNLFSLCSSLKAVGEQAIVTSDIKCIESADRLILPGVGAFGDAAQKLKKSGLDKVVKQQADKGKPLLGICLGMQLLFERSFEYGEHDGLCLIKGSVVPMSGIIPTDLKIPHIGWNALRFKRESPLFRYINDFNCVYFIHSYYADNCEESVIADVEYGIDITAAVQRENVFGCQFHPEKSGAVGLNILRAFCEIK